MGKACGFSALVSAVALCSAVITGSAYAAGETALAATRPAGESRMNAEKLMDLALAHMQASIDLPAGRRVELGRGKMDARLAMPACQQPLKFEAQRHSARGERLLVKTVCEDKKRWAVYVPLAYREYAQAVVSVHPIARGQAITKQDIEIREVPVQRLGGNFLPAMEQALGMLSTRNIQAGQALQPSSLKAPLLVRRGDQVVILANSGPVSVRMNGTALADGSAEQQIRVKNMRSQRIIRARVVKTGTVEALM